MTVKLVENFIGIRNNQNIFRKFITNNSENKQELSYTPKLPYHPTAPEPIASALDSKNSINIVNPPPEKRITKNKNLTKRGQLSVVRIKSKH